MDGLFTLSVAFFAIQKLFSWMWTQLSIFAFVAVFWGHSQKVITQTNVKVFPYDSF